MPLLSNLSSTNINFDLSSLPIINLCDNRDNINSHKNSTTDTLNHKNIINVNTFTSKGSRCRKVRIKKNFNEYINYICNYHGCNYSTVNHGYFEKHKRSHTKESPFKCPKCERRFTQKSNLTTHLDTHSGYRRFECTICFKRFPKKSALSQHLKIHSGQKPHKSPYLRCSKSFGCDHEDHLKSHWKINSGEKHHKCTYSGYDKSFVTVPPLILHNMDHTGMRPNISEYNECNERFRAKSLLKNDIYTPSKIELFKCVGCNKGFSQKDQWNKHKCSGNMGNIEDMLKMREMVNITYQSFT